MKIYYNRGWTATVGRYDIRIMHRRRFCFDLKIFEGQLLVYADEAKTLWGAKRLVLGRLEHMAVTGLGVRDDK